MRAGRCLVPAAAIRTKPRKEKGRRPERTAGAPPLRRFEAWSPCVGRVTPTAAASHGVRRSPESCVRPDRGPIGLSAPASASAFPPGPRGVFRPPSTASVTPAASSSHELFASFRVLRRPTCPSAARAVEERLPWGSAPSSRHQLRRPPTPGDPTPELRSALGVSHALDGLLRHQPSRACSIPQPRPGFALQGFVPLAEPCRVSQAVHALWSLSAPACGLTRASRRALGFRALLPARVRCRAEAVSRRSVRAPLGLLPPPGDSLLATQGGLLVPSALDLHRDDPTAAGPRRLAVCEARFAWMQATDPLRFLAWFRLLLSKAENRGRAPDSPSSRRPRREQEHAACHRR
jgi:hypothetical protein